MPARLHEKPRSFFPKLEQTGISNDGISYTNFALSDMPGNNIRLPLKS